MISRIRDIIVKINSDEELRVFNLVHIICAVGMLLMCFAADYYINDKRGVYFSFGVMVLLLLTIIEANRTKSFVTPVLFMSFVYNFVYLPFVYISYNRFLVIIPIYFIFGILYSIFFINRKTGLFLAVVEVLFYTMLIMYGSYAMNTASEGLTTEEIKIRYMGAGIATLVSGFLIGLAIRFRYVHCLELSRQAEENKIDSMEAYVAKDMFLTNMSHEIRTPMNAIVGTVNLLLDREVNEKVSESAYNILNSCNALLSIVDGLMDLSKSEGGDVRLFLSEYHFDEFMMDVINMVTVRLTESNLDFYVDINKDIPKVLLGDTSKIRQLFVNVLNNAIKYTQKGKICLRVDYRKISYDTIELIVDVEDTGVGIEAEMIGKLFIRHDFNDAEEGVDEEKRSNPLGLAICAEILQEMGGTISVKSKPSEGSVFTFRYEQKFISNESLIEANDFTDVSILVYESNDEYSGYDHRLLTSLGIKNDCAKSTADFERLLSVNKYSHVLVDNRLAEKCNRILGRRLNSETIVSLINIDDSINIDKATTVLNRPVNIINIIALLKNENNNFVRDIMRKGGFICPNANILVVDDNHTNLNVASSLLKKYEANVYTAVSGKECIRMLKENEIDIVFLDYMMPEMNGIDTLNNIRKLPGSKYMSMPVIALTANVISGAREMFLEEGFDEFLAKPIAIDRMERVLKKYLPKNLIVAKSLQDEDR